MLEVIVLPLCVCAAYRNEHQTRTNTHVFFLQKVPTETESQSTMSEHKYKLTYFDLRGRAEVARLVLGAAGQTCEDVRIGWDQWPELKPS
jgi:hypothetical protein